MRKSSYVGDGLLALGGGALVAHEFLEREFPENASELPQGITRRTMLTLLGASLSAAGLSACRRPVEKIVPYVEAPDQAREKPGNAAIRWPRPGSDTL